MKKIDARWSIYSGYVIGISVYLFVIAQEQIFSDEYDLLGSGEDLSKHIMKDGRPIGALVYKGMAFLVDSPADIFILRLFGLAASLTLLIMISREISRVYPDDFLRLFISTALFLPVFVLYISWGMLSYFMIASLISFVSYKQWISPSRRSKVIALLLQILVLLVYPPSAFSSFAFMGVICLISKVPLVSEIRKMCDWIVLNLFAGLSSILIVFFDSNLRGYSLNSRVKFLNLSDVLEKISWLISRPLIISTRFFDIRSPNTVAAMVAFLFFLIVFFLGFNRYHFNERHLLSRVALFIASLFLSLSPIALSADNQFDYRLILGSSVSLYIAFVFATLQIIKRSFESVIPIIITFTLLVSVGGVTMYSHSTKLFIDPYVLKQQLIYRTIDDCILNNNRIMRIVLNGRESIYPFRENLGLFSMRTDMASDWVPIPSFRLVLKNLKRSEILVVWADDEKEKGLHDCQIEMSKFVDAFSN